MSTWSSFPKEKHYTDKWRTFLAEGFQWEAAFCDDEDYHYEQGDPIEDFKNGIPHLTIGEDSGLVKEIKFNRADIPHARTARATAAERVLGQLMEKYNADVTLVGNTHFTPADWVFINPSLTGLGNPAQRGSMLRELGLGGYYVVNRINLELSEGFFETHLKCIWQKSGG